MAAKKQTVNLGKKGSFTVKKGALHKALGKSQDSKLSASDLQKGLNSSNPKTRRQAASAKGFKAMAKKKKGK